MKLLVVAVTLLAFAGAAAADDITVTARVDRETVSVNGAVTLTITVEGTMRSVPQPTLPPLETDFTVRSRGSSSNFSMANGRVSVSKSWTFALYPKKTGTFTVGAAEIEFGGATYSTDPIEIEVVEGQPAPRATQPERRSSTGAQSSGRDVFITTTVDRRRAFVDEQITLSFKLYLRVEMWEHNYQPAELTGFWVEKLPEQEKYIEDVDGVAYNVIEVKTALFGAASGEATIGPASLTYRTQGAPFTFFSRPGRQQVLTTKPITIEILPLPTEGRPSGFNGAVGSYRVRSTLDPTTLNALEPATLKIRVSGRGNIRTVRAPAIPDLPEFKIYESGSSTNVTKEGGVLGGNKTFEYVIVPQTPGSKIIPGPSLSFYDPASRSYRTSEVGDMALEVAPAAEGAGETILPARARISRLGRDIRYIREPTAALVPAPRPVHARPWFLALQAIPLVALAGTWAGRRRRDRFAREDGLARYVRAGGRARGELKEARAHLGRGDRAATCAAVSRAVTNFIGDRLNVQAQGMTAGELGSALASVGAGPELIERTRRLMSECDLGRFAGSADAAAEDCLRELAKISTKRRR